jgi:hypothetical protein
MSKIDRRRGLLAQLKKMSGGWLKICRLARHDSYTNASFCTQQNVLLVLD